MQDLQRDVAQFGRALSWGGRGRGFKSRRSDQFLLIVLESIRFVMDTLFFVF